MKHLLLMALLLGTLGLQATADPPPPPEPANPPPPGLPMGKDNPVHIYADQFVYESSHKLLHLEGHVRFVMKDTEMETQHAEFDTGTQIGKLTGGVHISQPGSNVTSDHMLIFYDRRRALLSGGVHLVTTQQPGKAAPAASATPQPPTTLDCDELEYFWETQLGNAVGGVHVQQGERKASADVAHYNGATKLVVMNGHVMFANNGDWLHAPEATLNLQDQTFVAQGGVEGLLDMNENQQGKPGASPAPVVKPPVTTRVMVPPMAPVLQPVAPAGNALHALMSTTESRLPDSLKLDELPIGEVLQLMNQQDATVPLCLAKVLPAIEAAVDAIVQGFQAGGRLFYVGAGTSGRLGVLDAAECPPTFGTPPDQVQAILAGGLEACWRAVEGAEDDENDGRHQVALRGVGRADRVVGISASGRTPFTLSALQEARQRTAVTIGLTCNQDAPLLAVSDHPIVLDVGPEVVTGSTRLKAGTAQKLVLNLLSTASLVKSGRVYGNLMVGLLITNAKLRGRATRILQQELSIGEEAAQQLLTEAGGSMPVAFLMGSTGAPHDQVRKVLSDLNYNVRAARQRLTTP